MISTQTGNPIVALLTSPPEHSVVATPKAQLAQTKNSAAICQRLALIIRCVISAVGSSRNTSAVIHHDTCVNISADTVSTSPSPLIQRQAKRSTCRMDRRFLTSMK